MKTITTVRSLKNQAGLSLIAWMAILVVVVIFGLSAYTLVPIYADNLYVRDGLKSLKELEKGDGNGFAEVSNAAIRTHLRNFFKVNRVNNDAFANLKIDRQRNKVLVNMDYEVRAPLYSNISFVVSFTNQYDSTRPNECCDPVEP